MQFATRKVTASAMTTVALLTVAACDRTMEPTAASFKPAVNFATALVDEQIPRYAIKRVGEEGGRPVFELDRVCDVFIGEPVIDPADGAPQRYTHQAVVEEDNGTDAEGNALASTPLPAGSIVRLKATEAQAPGKLFTCDAVDRDENGVAILDAAGNEQPVIDPVTLHAAKGDAPQVTTSGVTLDLNGYSITVSPAFGTRDGFENIGVVLAGDDQTLTNSTREVSKIYGFGHNIDIEAVRPKVLGTRWDGDGDPATTDWVYNIETQGGMGIRLSDGPALFDQVKSVDLDPVAGQGFEARRMNSGILTVTNSHFVGGTEGVFLREVSGVTFEGNYVSGQAGEGISTRQAVSTLARPIIIRNNVVESNAANGIVWGRDSRSNNSSLVISGNKISSYGQCGIAVSRRNTTTAPYTLNTTTNTYPTLAAANTFDRTTRQTCRLND